MSHVAIVLPGQSYGPDQPGLAIPMDVLRDRDAHVVAVEYPPPPWPDCPDVVRGVLAASYRCLSVFAPEDPAHDPDSQVKVTETCNGIELALEGAGHRLAMSDEQRLALRRAVEDFL